MQPAKVVIPQVTHDIICHKLTRWLLNFKYPVMFQTAKKRSTAALSQHAPISPILACSPNPQVIDDSAGWCIEIHDHSETPVL